jgi:hypothetical protein
MVCEDTDPMRGFESCVNCPDDCGTCPVHTCAEGVTCAIGCFLSGGFPDIFCLTDCISQTCADGQFFLRQVIMCATRVFGDGTCMIGGGGGGGGLMCITTECSSEIAACFGSSC